ncbi:MAG: Ig-like domain-containing protein [Crocosphaera sp.]
MATRNVIGTGNWTNVAIWEGGLLPTSGDDVVINVADTILTVTLTTNVDINSVANFETFQWNSGTITIENGFNNNSTLNIGSSGNENLYGSLNNFGIVNHNDSYYSSSARRQIYQNLYVRNGGEINNNADATYNFTSGIIAGAYPADYQGEPSKFNNQGTFNKGSTLVSTVSVELDNSGVINVNNGTLDLTNKFNNTGTVNVNAGAFRITGETINSGDIDVNAGYITMTGGGTQTSTNLYVDVDAYAVFGGQTTLLGTNSLTGRGDIYFNSGELIFDVNNTSLSDELRYRFNSGKLNYEGDLSLDKYVIENNTGALINNDNARLNLGTGSWNQGSLTVDERVSFNGTLNIGNAGHKNLYGSLNNFGVVNHNDSYYSSSARRQIYQNLYVRNGGEINNNADATYNFTSGIIAQGSSDGGATEARFNNSGTLRKNGTLNSYIDIDLFNDGILETTAGNLYIRNDFINTGTVNVRGGIAHFSSDFDQTAGEIILHNGRLNSTQEMNIQDGQIGGYGTIGGSVLNSGLLNPFVDGELGSDFGDINITGDYTETDEAVINIQIGGEDPGTEFDVIDITGTANFDGTINVSLLDDFFPVLGDSFQVINYGGYTGDTELDFTGLIIGNGLRLNPIFSDTNLTFVVGETSAPDAKNDSYGVYQGQTLTINPIEGVLANDTHPDGEPLTAELDQQAQFGMVTVNEDGSFTYMPNTGFLGVDTFQYTAFDLDRDFDSATVTINVTAPPDNLAPLVNNPIPGISVEINAIDTTIDLTNTFTDPDDDDSLITQTVISNSNETLVNASVLDNTLTLDYLPDQTGSADITIEALSNGQTVTETFTVFVGTGGGGNGDPDQDPIVANHLPAVILNENAANSEIDLTNVFTDPDNDDSLITKSVLLNTNPTLFNSISIVDNTLTLDYATNQFGTAEILIQATSNGKTVTEAMTVVVNEIDSPPIVANPIQDITVKVDADDDIIDIINVFTDVDNDDNAIFKVIYGNTNSSLVTASLIGNDLTLDYDDIETGSADITILAISNGKTVQDTFTVTLEPNGPEVDPPIPNQTIKEGEMLTFPVDSYFSDPDNDPLTYTTSPLPNWLIFDADTQTFTGKPDNSAVGTISVTVTADDNSDGTVSDTFDITVMDVPNGTFNLEVDTYSVNESDGILPVNITRTDSTLGEVSVNLTTSNGTAIASQDYTGGTYTVTFADGETSQTVDIPIINDDLPEGGFNQDPETFNLTLTNPTGGAILGTDNTAVVNIIDDEPAIQKPVAVNDSKDATISQTITIDVLGNDYDPDNYREPIEIHRITVDGVEYNPYTESPITTPTGGIIALFNNNTVGDRTDDQLYYTSSGSGGSDSFTYTIKDGDLDSDLISDPGTVTVNIAPENRTETDNIDLTINGNIVNYLTSEIESYGDQDFNGNYTLYENDTIDLDGNTWKAIALKDYGYENGYIISDDTQLTFDFKSSTLGEIQGIGWDTENNTDSQINPSHVINIYGTNVSYGITDFEYTNIGSWQTFTVNLSDYDNDIMTHLLVIGDDDANDKGDAQFRNIQLNQTSTNRRPNANPDYGFNFTTPEDGMFTTGNVLDNDTDPDNDILNVESFDTTNTLGLVTYNGDGTFEYDPNGQFNYLNTGETTTDSFTYIVSDGNGGTDDPTTVNITITGVTTDGLIISIDDDVVVETPITYGDGSILNGNSLPQDTPESVVTYQDNNNGIKIENNAWKKTPIGNYTVNEQTILAFEFRSTDQGEIQGIGLENNDNVFDERQQLFQLYGTQNFGNQAFNNYQNGEGWKSYRISVGQYMTGVFDNIVFINDNDSDDNLGSSSEFRNIKLYQPDPLTITINGISQTNYLQTYGDDSVNNGNSLPQDTPEAVVTYPDNGNEVKIENNGWKYFDLGNYNITENTQISFQFRSDEQVELQGIGYDNDDNLFNNTNTIFQLYGNDTFANQDFKNYQGLAVDDWKDYSINLGQYLPENFTEDYNRLVFFNDQDSNGNIGGSSQFRNIVISEV